MIVNHSAGFPNWSQLKNYQEPYSTCNTTSAIGAAQCAGFDIMACRKSTDPNTRPADDLYTFVHTDTECLAMREKLCRQAGLSPDYPPNELMEVLAFGLGKWLNAPESVEFHFSLPLKLILNHILSGGTGVLHGRYPTQKKEIDHMNAIVGAHYDAAYDLTQSPTKILIGFIIDDPYGDYRNLYTGHMGNDIFMPIEDIKKYIKPLDTIKGKDIILVHRKKEN